MSCERSVLVRELQELQSPPSGGLFSYTTELVAGVGWCSRIFAPVGPAASLSEHQSWLETALGRGRQP